MSDKPPRECTVEGCHSKYLAQGFCRKHYQNARLHGNPIYQEEWINCPVNGCINRILGTNKSGLCKWHYQFGWRYSMTRQQVEEVWLERQCSNLACRSVEQLHWDHDHTCCSTPPTCGKCNRGWLCAGCNKALGYIQDNPEKLQGLIDHLSRGFYKQKS